MQEAKGKDIYRWILQKRDDSTLEKIAQIKRFSECLVGDHVFREKLVSAPGKAAELVQARGIELDPEELAPMWKNGLRLSFSAEDKDGRLPSINLWLDWIRDLREFRGALRGVGENECPEKRFVSWRGRQMARSDSQLGDHDKAIPHPAVAFELSEGCSRGCWFCGLGAESFKGYIPYSQENRKLWRGVLSSFQDAFGGLLETGFCYWATEPTDNPDYLKFLNDFYDISGIYPQTTTSASVKDLTWSRELLQLHATHRSIPCRFSVLEVETLHKLHDYFSPRELLTTELVIHVKDSVIPKARAGRLRDQDGNADPKEAIRHVNTIACVSGFLINMVAHTLKLVSPCAASEQWPLGYRIHAQTVFSGVEDFQDKLTRMVETCMPETLDTGEPVSFRKDLVYRETSTGIELENNFSRYVFTNREPWHLLGNGLVSGNYSWDELIDQLIDGGVDVLTAMGALNRLHAKGLLDDEPQRPVTV